MADLPLGVAKINELLKEVTVDYSRTDSIDGAVAAVREVLLSLPDQKVSASLGSKFVEDLGVPAAKAGFTFVKPDSVTVVGSYASKTVTRPDEAVDLAIRMPKSCFWDKDYLNHRYHAKRALYLVVIMHRLKTCKFVVSTEWSTFNHDARKPVLVVHVVSSTPDGRQPTVLKIIPTISKEVFVISKLVPSRNNVRGAISEIRALHSMLTSPGLPDLGCYAGRTEGVAQPTPHYSASILEDMFIEEHNELLKDVFTNVAVFREVLCLLKVWLRQRAFHHSQDSLGSHLMAMIVAHLTTSAGGRRLGNQMSVLQLFRIISDSIANADLLGKGVFLSSREGPPIPLERKRLMEQFFEVNICDTSALYNVAYRMSKSALSEVKDAAAHTLAALGSSRDSGFDAVFMTPMDFASKFDYHIRIDPPERSVSKASTSCCLDEELWRVFERQIESVLEHALQDRATIIRVVRRCLPKLWSVDQGLASVGKEPVFAGILLKDISIALRMATVGPNAENKEESKHFRAFWGSKAELRRWADGTITEAAAWECDSWQRHLIIKQIIEHVFARQFGDSIKNVHVVADQLDFCLLENGKDLTSALPKVLEALKILSDRLRSLDNLPLKVVGIHAISSAFRHAAVFPPQPHPLANDVFPQNPPKFLPACVDPLEVLIQLEGSGSWPDDIVAVKKTKMAFCLKIAESLQRKWGLPYVAADNWVDVLMHGFAFRLGIFYERDPTRLSKDRLSSLLSSESPLKEVINFDSTRMRLKEAVPLDEDVVLRSLHAKMLDSLQGVYPVYGPTVRLAKRWLSSHFLSGTLCQEAVELLVAYLFVKPYPYSPPASRVTGFLRFLNLIAKHDWDLVPIIVDVNGDLDANDYDTIMEHFDALRLEKDLAREPAMYIATPYDTFSETWTWTSPSTKDLRRLVAYARAAAALGHRLICMQDDNWPSLFRTPLNCFDALIHLHHGSLPHPGRILFKNDLPKGSEGKPSQDSIAYLSKSVVKLGPEKLRKQLLIGFDPVACLVADMKVTLGSTIHVWYEPFGGTDIIPLSVDKLSRVQIADGKVEDSEYHETSRKRKRPGNGVHFSIDNLVSQIYELGEGLVKYVQLIEGAQKTTCTG